MTESIEKLREFVDDQFVISGQAYLQGMAIAGSIEREIAERYMLLPVDADGVPIHVGDMVNGWGTLQMHGCGDQPVHGMYCTARFVGDDIEWRIDNEYGFEVEPHYLHHVKPDPLKELLENGIMDCLVWTLKCDPDTGEPDPDDYWHIDSDEVVELCKRIRELLGGDAE